MKPNNPPEHHLSSLAGKLAGVFYSLCCYLFFLLITLYLIGFLSGIGVPKDINTGPSLNWPLAVIVDTLLITLFAVQHSGMARQRFKRWWTQRIPPPIERATYVLSTCIVLTLLFWLWQPITTPIWNVTSAWGHKLLMTLFWLGCGIAILATFLISHFELLGIQQTLNAWRPGRPDTPTFKTPLSCCSGRRPT
jgi:protein-S-isoprenylcysteine O-methyltransferase Ste14